MSLYTLRQQVIALTDALQTVETQLASFSRSTPSAAVHANDSPAPATAPIRRFPPSIWPRVGGLGRLEPTSDLFARDAYRNAYRPGLARQIYAGACFGLRRLSATLQVPLQKVSTCSAGRLLEPSDSQGSASAKKRPDWTFQLFPAFCRNASPISGPVRARVLGR